MNNILNEIGIENYIFPFYDTFVLGFFIIQAKCNYRIYVCRNYAERSQSLFVAFSITKMHKDNFCLFSMAVAAAEVAVISHSSFDI
jgi:hypothetical protein